MPPSFIGHKQIAQLLNRWLDGERRENDSLYVYCLPIPDEGKYQKALKLMFKDSGGELKRHHLQTNEEFFRYYLNEVRGKSQTEYQEWVNEVDARLNYKPTKPGQEESGSSAVADELLDVGAAAAVTPTSREEVQTVEISSSGKSAGGRRKKRKTQASADLAALAKARQEIRERDIREQELDGLIEVIARDELTDEGLLVVLRKECGVKFCKKEQSINKSSGAIFLAAKQLLGIMLIPESSPEDLINSLKRGQSKIPMLKKGNILGFVVIRVISRLFDNNKPVECSSEPPSVMEKVISVKKYFSDENPGLNPYTTVSELKGGRLKKNIVGVIQRYVKSNEQHALWCGKMPTEECLERRGQLVLALLVRARNFSDKLTREEAFGFHRDYADELDSIVNSKQFELAADLWRILGELISHPLLDIAVSNFINDKLRLYVKVCVDLVERGDIEVAANYLLKGAGSHFIMESDSGCWASHFQREEREGGSGSGGAILSDRRGEWPDGDRGAGEGPSDAFRPRQGAASPR